MQLAVGGTVQNLAGIPTNPENRFRDLKEWEVKVGNFKTKANIFFDEDGNIKIDATENGGYIRVENENGFFELKADGQFNANNNLTVEP